jgi:hypothetical protein
MAGSKTAAQTTASRLIEPQEVLSWTRQTFRKPPPTQRARDVRACGQTGEDGQDEIMEARSTGPVDLLDGVHLCVLPAAEVLFGLEQLTFGMAQSRGGCYLDPK